MSQQIEIVFDGPPVAWAAHGGYGKRSFNPRFKEKAAYKWQMASQFNSLLLECPISISVTYEMPIPKTTRAKNKALIKQGLYFPTKRPDIDNLNKFLLDVLKQYVFVDDSQVVQIIAKKIYSDHPQTIVHIEPL